MPRQLLADHLAVEGVDELALVDMLKGIGEVADSLDTLPFATRQTLLDELDRRLARSRLSLPPLGKFIVQAMLDGARQPAILESLEEELRAASARSHRR